MGESQTLGQGSPAGEIRVDGPIECIVCGDSLLFLPDAYPLTFHCESGHFLTLSDLLDEALNQRKEATRATPAVWAEMAGLLRELASRALRFGHTFTAADFHEASDRIDGWVLKLSALLSGGASSSRSPG